MTSQPTSRSEPPQEESRPLVVHQAGAEAVLVGRHGYLLGGPEESIDIRFTAVPGDGNARPVLLFDLAGVPTQTHPMPVRT